MRAAAAHGVAVRVAGGAALAQAGEAALADVRRCGGTGGLIAVTAEGTVAMPFTSGAMNRGAWREKLGPEVWV